MGTRHRELAPGGIYHITQRGNNRQAVFHTDPDRLTWLRYLKEYSTAAGCPIHAYCLMGNHVHLILTAPDTDAVSRLMCRLQGRYARHFNHTWHRSGSLWNRRFHHVPIESDSQLLSCMVYLDRNPLEAKLCQRAEQYPWSSHRVYALGEKDALVTEPQAILGLGRTREVRRRMYRQALEDSLRKDPIRQFLL
jgi:putative transposase